MGLAIFAQAVGADARASETLRRLAIDTGAPLSLEELGLPRAAIDVVVRDLNGSYDPQEIRALLEDAFVPMMRTSTEGGSS